MAGCGNCGCGCLIVNEDGVPYEVGEDVDGNAAIVVPSQLLSGCSIIEFVFDDTSCTQHREYSFVCPGPLRWESATAVLSVADDAPVVLELRKNGVSVGQATIMSGATSGGFGAGTLPLETVQGDRVDVVIVSAGTIGPTVAVAFVACLGINAAARRVTLGEVLALPARGALEPGETPEGVGVPALAAEIGTVARFDGIGRATSLWVLIREADGVTVRWAQITAT